MNKLPLCGSMLLSFTTVANEAQIRLKEGPGKVMVASLTPEEISQIVDYLASAYGK